MDWFNGVIHVWQAKTLAAKKAGIPKTKHGQAINLYATVPGCQLLKRAGLRYRNPYQTRHSYASILLTAGEDSAWISTQMGHADLGIIFRVYAKWIKSKGDKAGEKAVTMFAASAEADDSKCQLSVSHPRKPA